MALVSLPIFGLRKGEKTTHALIFELLLQRFPLTIGELWDQLRKTRQLNLSYQAVRKSVLGLHGSGVLERRKAGYQISIHWLLLVRAFADDALAICRSPAGATFNKKAVFQEFVADSLYEADTLWGDIVLQLARAADGGSPEYLSINHYPWWLPINLGRESDFCAQLAAYGVVPRYVFSKRGAASRWAREMYSSLGVAVSVQRIPAIPDSQYFSVIGDWVIEVRLPEKLVQRLEELFGAVKRPADFLTSAMTKLAKERMSIGLSVQRNVLLAKALGDMIIGARGA